MKKMETFYEHYRVAWLYAPDEVIKSINDFLIAMGDAPKTTETEAEKVTRKMIFEMRRSFKGKTKLKPKDFLFIAVSKHKRP